MDAHLGLRALTGVILAPATWLLTVALAHHLRQPGPAEELLRHLT